MIEANPALVEQRSHAALVTTLTEIMTVQDESIISAIADKIIEGLGQIGYIVTGLPNDHG